MDMAATGRKTFTHRTTHTAHKKLKLGSANARQQVKSSPHKHKNERWRKTLKTVTKSRDCEEVQPEVAPPDGVFQKLSSSCTSGWSRENRNANPELESNPLVGLLGLTGTDQRRAKQMESVRPESSRDDLKIFSARVVEKLSRSPKSGQSCLTESASANAGNSGPIWLKEEETGWPDFSNTQIPSTIQSEIESETRSSTFSATAAILVPTTNVEWHLDGISTWNRLVRRTA